MNRSWNLQQTPHTSPYQASLEKIDRALATLHYITAITFPLIYLPNNPILYKALCIFSCHRHSNDFVYIVYILANMHALLARSYLSFNHNLLAYRSMSAQKDKLFMQIHWEHKHSQKMHNTNGCTFYGTYHIYTFNGNAICAFSFIAAKIVFCHTDIFHSRIIWRCCMLWNHY